MDTFEEFYEQIKKEAINHWKKDSYDTFSNAENDPVVNLFLSAFAYQAFGIQRNIENFESKSVQEFRDRMLPFNLIKPTPAFSIVQTKLAKTTTENDIKLINESFSFEFTKGKQKFNFIPLLKTKIINAELKVQEKTDRLFIVDLHSSTTISDLSGVSFYFDYELPIDIEIYYNGKELPLVRPNQYNELPFIKWFNNNHLFFKENSHLFGSYDYWQEIFLINNVQLFYVDQYEQKEFVFEKGKNIRLEILFKQKIDPKKCDIRINCLPIVNIEKREVTLTETKPIQELAAGNGEFLNLLCYNDSDDNMSLQNYIDSFLIRQFGVERYNTRQLLKQLHDLSTRYVSDHYAFQHIDRVKDDNNYDKMQKIMQYLDDLREVVEKINQEVLNKFDGKINNSYYALLRLNNKRLPKSESVHLEYLSTNGSMPNGIKKNEKPSRTTLSLDRNNTFLLRNVDGGKDSVKDEVQKENITRYYLLTKDRLVTLADVRAFCYKEMENHAKKIDISKKEGLIWVNIKLNEDYLIQNKDELELQAKGLQKKLELRSSGLLPYHVRFT